MKDTPAAGNASNAIEKVKDAFIAKVKEEYGYKGKKQAMEFLAETETLFMSSNCSNETKLEFLRAFMVTFWEVKAENRRKYTRKDYRKSRNQCID